MGVERCTQCTRAHVSATLRQEELRTCVVSLALLHRPVTAVLALQTPAPQTDFVGHKVGQVGSRIEMSKKFSDAACVTAIVVAVVCHPREWRISYASYSIEDDFIESALLQQ